MKLLQTNNLNFNGHGAGRIKALYMQNAYYPAQIPVYNELKRIGKAHNFDVFIHNKDSLLTSSNKLPSSEECDYELWSQDNKTIMHKDGKTTVISGLYMPQTEQNAAISLSRLLSAEHVEAEAFLEGGNFFIGKKPDGKNYLIIGYKDIHYSAMHYYLKDKLGKVNKDDMNDFIEKLSLKDENDYTIASYDEFDEEFAKWGKIALKKIIDIFEVEKQDVVVLSQGQYHNDLAIRPLNYPYVLVNDEKMSVANLQKLRLNFKFHIGAKKFIYDLEKKLYEQEKSYSSCDEICKELEEAGFIPIRIGGGYGLHTINFINSIVHQNGDDLIYITNSAQSGNKYYGYLQDLFEKDLKTKCPQIAKIYFVKGAVTNNKSNIVLEYLKQFKGGIHCLCCEEMKEYC